MSRSATRRRRRRSTTRGRWSPTAIRARPVAALLALVALAATGCGGDEATTGIDTSKPSSTATTPDGDIGGGRGGVELTEIGTFDAPLYVTQPDGAGDDIYVVEQGGEVQRVTPDGSSSTFLDVSDEIVSGGEQGLLSIAFAPDYAASGLLYADFTDPDGDTRVVEYRASGDRVDTSTGRELLAVDQPFPNHNGGLVLFGPDGKLYIGLGDGGSGGDPDRNGLDLTTLLGKILRIDPRPDGDRPYTIPADNPFVGDADARPEIYSYGLRNPWRFSFDADTADFSIGDVGQDTVEEIDLVGRGDGSGANFGWSAFEGDDRFNDDQDPEGAIPPVLTAPHSDGNCSITGGLVVRDRSLKTLYGRYLYGDLCRGELRSFTPRPGRPASDDVALGPDVDRLASFGEGADGTVYAVSISGPVYRLDPAR